MPNIDLVAFDGDDTLWQCQRLYTQAKNRFKRFFAARHDPEWIEQKLNQIETANLLEYGYGFKGFALSMVETAIALSDGTVASDLLLQTIDLARQIQRADVRLLEGAHDAVAQIAAAFPVVLITKGEFIEQSRKVQGSGLTRYMRAIEIVGEKTVETYREVLARQKVNPERFLMVGDSMRSDCEPVLKLGGIAVHIPSEDPWPHEEAEATADKRGRYYRLTNLAELPALVASLSDAPLQGS